ncbi:MAG: hypothetical protein COV29_03735 [Candidatus Yanofskybacteria bacterium CG10_big_fil_rev_8_21_14_0_10_36_16]|uniref:Magnesium transporter CorA n=1 Tax=Candidatus Yanofskybacteria bacterium CG10_big_fil_rev_8_21_14_0_10_36_16 TaxID=1975096 RepID=A0A2J0Q6K5_9BACT|nr:MAG: hypothetical protein COV29_03735 [Candidatus Yanofskybacteria bacterium CG10_big_fil_rev_8_21_14_0_10_36_16]
MISIYHKTIKDRGLNQIKEPKAGSWVYVENPSEKELEYLSGSLNLELDLLKDSVDPLEVPRLEIEDGKTYIFTRVPHKEGLIISTVPLLVIIGSDFITTISQKPIPSLNKFMEGKISFNTTQKTKLFLQIFSEINSAYEIFMTNINRQVRATRVHVQKISNREIAKFVTFEDSLNDFLSSLVPTNGILSRLLSGRVLELYEEDRDLVEDLLLGNNQLIELARSNLKSIVNVRGAYSTIMSNNLNRVVKFLTALTVVLNVPVIVSSLYGMNVNLPLADSPLAFWFIMGITLPISLVLFWIFVKKDWL